jgi:peptidoglycan hydrolase-like protein with peptidoglycan-binding domain
VQLLKLGARSSRVGRWQQFLRGQGYPVTSDNQFGSQTKHYTQAFQKKHGLLADGIVGGRTMGVALTLGIAGVAEVPGEDFPPEPGGLEPFTPAARAAKCGRFEFSPAPTARNPEGVKLDAAWKRSSIKRVELPQLVTLGLRKRPFVWVHRLIADDIVELFQAWEDAELLYHVKTWNGSFNARYIRGSTTRLSNHSWGTAFDINARWNRLGTVPALVGETGSVRELVALANKHGFWWGGHFKRKDGMHFESARRVR